MKVLCIGTLQAIPKGKHFVLTLTLSSGLLRDEWRFVLAPSSLILKMSCCPYSNTISHTSHSLRALLQTDLQCIVLDTWKQEQTALLAHTSSMKYAQILPTLIQTGKFCSPLHPQLCVLDRFHGQSPQTRANCQTSQVPVSFFHSHVEDTSDKRKY